MRKLEEDIAACDSELAGLKAARDEAADKKKEAWREGEELQDAINKLKHDKDRLGEVSRVWRFRPTAWARCSGCCDSTVSALQPSNCFHAWLADCLLTLAILTSTHVCLHTVSQSYSAATASATVYSALPNTAMLVCCRLCVKSYLSISRAVSYTWTTHAGHIMCMVWLAH